MVVTLVHQIPGDCCLYFPTEVGSTETYGDMKVTLSSKEQESSFVLRRDFKVTDTTNKQSSSVDLSHYHF